jgi:hypothetical protein
MCRVIALYKILVKEGRMKVIKFNEYLNESTTNYYPGYSDDGTAESLFTIREKTSKIVNEELEKAEKKAVSLNEDDNLDEDEAKFYQKWMFANMITTCLQDGFYINKGMMEKASKYYKQVLRSKFMDDNKTMKLQVMEVMKEIEKLEPIDGGKFYKPGFMREYIIDGK